MKTIQKRNDCIAVPFAFLLSELPLCILIKQCFISTFVDNKPCVRKFVKSFTPST